jgi:hypothetical protein
MNGNPATASIDTTSAELRRVAGDPPTVRMKLRYGINETLGWQPFALGADRERLWARLRDLDTQIIRIFAFSPWTPDPETSWPEFAAYIAAVLQAGAVPLITFAKLPQALDEVGGFSRFAERCGSVVARCIDNWGAGAVRAWWWSIGNKPNGEWAEGATFDHYRDLYLRTATAIRSRLASHLEGQRPMIGGPAVDGFRPFWIDWIWRFVNEIDNSLIGFVAWNRHGDWREPGTWGAPSDARAFQRLLISRTRDYERRALGIRRMLEGRGILNVCSELGPHAHHEPRISRPLNQTTFGAAYYGSALVRLMRGQADAEMLWTGTDDGGPYGIMDAHGQPNPVYHAKRLCVEHVRFGDQIEFPSSEDGGPPCDMVVARGEDLHRSALIAYRDDLPATFDVSGLAGLSGCSRLLTVDGEGARIVESRFDGTVSFRGFGVAVVTNRPERTRRS